MLRSHPLQPLSISTAPFIKSVHTAENLYTTHRYSLVSNLWVRPCSKPAQTAFLEISASGHTYSVRNGIVHCAIECPDGSFLSLENDSPGPFQLWTFRNAEAFLNRDGEHHPSTVQTITRVGDTIFAKKLRDDSLPPTQRHELLARKNGQWKGLGIFGDFSSNIHALTEHILCCAAKLYRWDGHTLTHLTDINHSHTEDLSAQIHNDTFLLNGRKLARLEPDSTITDIGWPVENLMGLWAVDGLLFTLLGKNKRSWIAALYDPKTGRSRGFKRRDFGLDPYESPDQWLVTHNRLFFIANTKHYELDLPAVRALRTTKLRA